METRTKEELYKKPKPVNPAELEILSLWYFGKKLHLSRLSIYGRGRSKEAIGTAQYEVKEEYNSYHGSGWLFGSCSTDGYDYSRCFWRHVIGPLYCGGIADKSYGQADIFGYRNKKRLQEFEGYLRRNESGRLRTSFKRLALNLGEGENMVNLDSHVQTLGRADGAEAVFNQIQPF